VLAGLNKFINEGLMFAGVLDGDGRKHVIGFGITLFMAKMRPRVEVTITPVPQHSGVGDPQVVDSGSERRYSDSFWVPGSPSMNSQPQ
jgi:hypothetical protein